MRRRAAPRPDWIGPEPACRRARSARILRRHGVPYLRDGDPMTGEVITASSPPRCATNASGPASWCTSTSRRSAGSPTAAAGGPTAAPRAATERGRSWARSATTTSTPWSMTTPDWPAPRSWPTSRARPAPAFLRRAAAFFAAHGITRIERADDRQRPGPTQSNALRRGVRAARRASDLHRRAAPGRTARSNGSTGPCRPSGPTARVFASNDDRSAALATWLEHYSEDPTRLDLLRGLGTDDNPVFAGMHHAAAHVVGATRRGRPAGVERREHPLREHHRRPAPRDARPGQRLLRLQRRRGRHPVAARPGRRAGGVRRRRRPPRRRRRADLLGRPAGAHDLAARDRPDAVPGHRLPDRPGRVRGREGYARSTWPLPSGTGDAGWLRAFHAVVPAADARVRPRRSWSPSTAATPTSRTRSRT